MNSFKHIIKELLSILKPNALVGVYSSIFVLPVTVMNAFFLVRDVRALSTITKFLAALSTGCVFIINIKVLKTSSLCNY